MRRIKRKRKQKQSVSSNRNAHPSTNQETGRNRLLLSPSIKDNIEQIQRSIGPSSDVTIRQFCSQKGGDADIAIIFIDGMVNENIISDFIITPIMGKVELLRHSLSPLFDLEQKILQVGNVKRISEFESLYTSILSGDTVILLDKITEGIVIDTKSWEGRGVTEAQAQTVIRGPHEGFTEALRVNTSLIRRRIKDKNLCIETKQIGTRTKTEVAIIYIKDIADEKIVQEVRNRLEHIQLDGILDSGNIEELIQDNTFTPFPTIQNSERPDSTSAGILEGRVAIIVDGSPYALLVPALFIQFLQSPEDYYQRLGYGFIRFLRYVSVFISLLAPSLYIAITTFHQEMLKTTLLISIAAQREGIPFPAFVEALIMEITFELLREAGIRMPRAIGPAISIVGALVLGEAAVGASLVSPAMVIVVSITAIAGFTFPTFSIGIPFRILRFGLMVLAATFGLFGIIVGLIAVILHLCSLQSFGVPYMYPFAPLEMNDQKDAVIRFPKWMMKSRPKPFTKWNQVRMGNSYALNNRKNKR
ncbi:spore germination protein [Fervidibacillus halotolerans]|uniref:Spore germination protein n=1 Tax=Fervidibacillus halotolerans TaxID=2980027 RepID=A0A9E8RYX2_9BACI|nr:spore germination protein [Fervidibacillus halotolerans]WAA12708.1 spore germination protein [Fervidibacillus halotolerans]